MSDKKKILVVDDEIHIVQVVAIKLKNNGFDVITAGDGKSAYDLACSEKPDAIVTDWQMPAMTGIEMIEKLREDGNDIPVIMLTARGFALEEDRKERLKIVDCLTKPFSPKELLSVLENALCESSVS